LVNAIAELLFYDTFRYPSNDIQPAIESSLHRYQALVHDKNIYYQRMKNIWISKIAVQEILNRISSNAKSVAREEVQLLLHHINSEIVSLLSS
jgi:hypothetical protein